MRILSGKFKSSLLFYYSLDARVIAAGSRVIVAILEAINTQHMNNIQTVSLQNRLKKNKAELILKTYRISSFSASLSAPAMRLISSPPSLPLCACKRADEFDEWKQLWLGT